MARDIDQLLELLTGMDGLSACHREVLRYRIERRPTDEECAAAYLRLRVPCSCGRAKPHEAICDYCRSPNPGYLTDSEKE